MYGLTGYMIAISVVGECPNLPGAHCSKGVVAREPSVQVSKWLLRLSEFVGIRMGCRPSSHLSANAAQGHFTATRRTATFRVRFGNGNVSIFNEFFQWAPRRRQGNIPLSEYRSSTVSTLSKYGLGWSWVRFGLVPNTVLISSWMKARPRATRRNSTRTAPYKHAKNRIFFLFLPFSRIFWFGFFLFYSWPTRSQPQ